MRRSLSQILCRLPAILTLWLLMAGGCSAATSRVVNAQPRYHVFFAPGDEYEVVERVQLTRSIEAQAILLRSKGQYPPDMGTVLGYLEPGTRLRVEQVVVSWMDEVQMQRIYPKMRVLPDHPYDRPIVPTHVPPKIFGIDGIPTDVQTPDPDYLRKLGGARGATRRAGERGD